MEDCTFFSETLRFISIHFWFTPTSCTIRVFLIVGDDDVPDAAAPPAVPEEEGLVTTRFGNSKLSRASGK